MNLRSRIEQILNGRVQECGERHANLRILPTPVNTVREFGVCATDDPAGFAIGSDLYPKQKDLDGVSNLDIVGSHRVSSSCKTFDADHSTINSDQLQEKSTIKIDREGFFNRVLEALGAKNGAEMARKLGLTKSTTHSWKDGRIPELSMIAEIVNRSEILGLSLHWLLTGQGPKSVNDYSDDSQNLLESSYPNPRADETIQHLLALIIGALRLPDAEELRNEIKSILNDEGEQIVYVVTDVGDDPHKGRQLTRVNIPRQKGMTEQQILELIETKGKVKGKQAKR